MAAGDLVSLADVKSWMNIASTTDDTLLSRLITSASNRIASYIQRNIGILSTAITETRNGSGTSMMMLKTWPVTAVASVSVGGVLVPQSSNGSAGWYAATWDGVSYPIPEPYIMLTAGYSPLSGSVSMNRWNGYFPEGAGNVIFTYTAGFSTVPADLYQACIEMVAQAYQRRGSRLDLKSVSQAQVNIGIIDGMTATTKEMLAPYRRVAPLVV